LDEAAAVARVSALGCAAERASCAQAWVSPQVFFRVGRIGNDKEMAGR